MGHALKARVENGRFVIDEPTNLPDGCEVEMAVLDSDDLDDDERAALHQSLEESFADEEAGRVRDYDTVMRELRSRL